MCQEQGFVPLIIFFSLGSEGIVAASLADVLEGHAGGVEGDVEALVAPVTVKSTSKLSR